jgi:DNA-binding FrmR family transcriptional regulator
MPRRTSYSEHKPELRSRLRKMEGQVRGLAQMIEDDRYCLDVAQQINALTAAGREVAVLVFEAHLRACVREAVEDEDAEAAIREITEVLRRSLRS